MLFFGAQDRKSTTFSYFVYLDFYQTFSLRGKKGVCGKRELNPSDQGQPELADKEPEAQSFSFYLWAIHFFMLDQASISDESDSSTEDD